MKWLSWFRYLVPKDEETESGFKAEIQRLSVIGLRAIAAVCIGATVVMMVVGALLYQDEVSHTVFPLTDLTVIGCGVAALALSFTRGVSRWARLLGSVVGYAVAVAQIATTLSPVFEAVLPGQAMAHVPRIVTLVLLVGMASLPMKPLQMLSLGLSIIATFLLLTRLMGRWDELASPSGIHTAMILVVVLVCTGLTAVIYKQRADAFRARRLAEQSFEELHRAQVKLLVSENAASQKRLAAAMSHELNTPLGVLTSAFDTVRQLYEKKGEDPDQNDRLHSVFDEAVRCGRQSSERLRDAVQRLKQLTALDRAEEQVVDLNDVWSDTVTFLRTELEGKADVSMDLNPLPRVKCRPQQLSAVFSNLLRNAAAAIAGRGRIAITSERCGGELVFRVRDNGRGIPPAQLEHLFEPAFCVEGSRVATSNWGLFVSRGIISDHGGHLDIDSTEGEGTTATIQLPLPT